MPPWKGQAPGRGSIGYQSNESARGRWQNEPATADPLSDDTLPSGGPERLASGQDDRFNTARRQPANRSFRGEDSSQSQDNRFNGNIQRRGPPKGWCLRCRPGWKRNPSVWNFWQSKPASRSPRTRRVPISSRTSALTHSEKSSICWARRKSWRRRSKVWGPSNRE